MKLKYADRADWHRVTDREYTYKFVDDPDFKGYITLISIYKVKEPLSVIKKEKQITLVDEGYYWMQHFPLGANYCVTTMLNNEKEIIQWYFDISKCVGISEQGVPYWEDLYLDLVVYPNGDFFVLDEDELQEALDNNQIDENDYRLAYEALNELLKTSAIMENKIIQITMKHFDELLKEALEKQRKEI